MSRNLLCLILFALIVISAPARGDSLSGLSDVTVVDGTIISFRYEGTEYVVEEGVVSLGTTTRWYIVNGVEILWEEGDPVPPEAPTVPDPSSNAKIGDVGSKGDNFMFTLNGSTNISSIDGINFQETVFPFLTNTFFHFERGGNDTGTWQAILADGSLGTPVSFSGAANYADTGVSVNGQNAYGVVFTTDIPVMGVRITAEGHDTLSISALTVIPFIATRPDPADGSLHEDSWVNLSWSPGRSAVSHDVYIGDNFDDVDNGTGDTFVGNQAGTFIVAGFPGMPIPDGLIPGMTYYWRIDEVNEAEPNSPWKGDIWSFSIPPKTAYFPDPPDGADSLDLNVQLSWTPGFGAILHNVYLGDNFDDVSNATGSPPSGSTTYNPGPLEMAKTYYWRVDEFDAFETYKGDVWSFITEGAVSNPNPANGAVDVTQTPVLTWEPGVFANTHDVFFGTDPTTLELKGSGNLDSESFEPGQLDWNTTYYWRIDEANNVNANSPWTGPLWSFNTANFLIIDDMESYNDIEEGQAGSNRIYNAWVDGYDDPTNGSQTGHLDPPFYEETIVHSGNKSMPIYYDNAVGKSEATLTLTDMREWTQEGVGILSLWFYGEASNAAEPMYVVLNSIAGVSHDDPDAALINAWTEWRIDLQAFADQGVNLANVNTITLGLGNRDNPVAGGSGMLYFDDIRLYKPVP